MPASPEPASPEPLAAPDLATRIARLIGGGGPMPVAEYMALCNAHYYATRDPLGARGDFTTAPEISQMFGELVGLCLADLWHRAGRRPAAYVELGPGRGTLAADALRAMARAGLEPDAHLVETSPVLRAIQAERVPGAAWHDAIDTLPTDRALLVVANEFFDALPVRQIVHAADGWRERMVTIHDGRLAPELGARRLDAAVPAVLRGASVGTTIETSPAGRAIVGALAARLVAQGGAVIAIDYGEAGPATGDTLQAVAWHRHADPFTDPGGRDLTAHVDFGALAEAARRGGAATYGPVPQGVWLRALGIDARAATLARGAPGRATEIAAARARLVEETGMGMLFKVMSVVAPGWPAPAGLA